MSMQESMKLYKPVNEVHTVNDRKEFKKNPWQCIEHCEGHTPEKLTRLRMED